MCIRDRGDRFNIQLNDITDPNALGPQSCTIIMKSGEQYSAECDTPYGSPGNRMKRPAREAKVARCFEVGGYAGNPNDLIEIIENVENLSDIRTLFSTVCD